jgi:hypothetical protein
VLTTRADVSITFDQGIAEFQGSTSPVSSASFTPAAVGEAVIAAMYVSANGYTMTLGGSGGGSYVSGSSVNIVASSAAAGYGLSLPASAQTISVASTAGFMQGVSAVVMAGVGTITLSTPTAVAAPGTGSGAVSGTAVSVASGSVLLACCFQFSNSGTEAITTPTGTSIYTNSFTLPYCWATYAGAGSNITPTFTAPTYGATGDYCILQALLSPVTISSGGGILNLPFHGLGAIAPLAWIIRRRQWLACTDIRIKRVD